MTQSTRISLCPLLAATFVLAIPSLASAQQGTTDTIALSGQAAPDTAGTNGVLRKFSAPVLNQVGQVAFNAFDITGTTFGFGNDEAVYLGSTSGLTQVAREGHTVPLGNGTFSSSLSSIPLINDLGQVILVDTNIQNTTNGSLDKEGIYRFTNNTLTQVRRRSTAGPEDLNTPSFSNSGRIAIAARSVTASSNDTSLVVTSGPSTTFPGINEGSLVPGGNGEYGDLLFSASNPMASNAAGQIALRISLTNTAGGTADNTAIIRSGSNVIIARESQAVSGGGAIGHMGSTSNNPVLSPSGQVAFFTSLNNTSNGSFDNSGIYRGNGSFLTQIAREGKTLSGGNGTFSFFNRPNDINTLNQVVFSAMLAGTTGGSIDNAGIYRGSGGTPTQIVRKNDAAPDGNGVFSSFSSSPYLNNTGQVVFLGNLQDTAGGTTDNAGIFMGDGQEVIRVAREGQALAGGTVIVGVSLVSTQKTGGNSPINDFGQVAFQASLTNGNQGVFLFTPELHYRRTFSSSWDSASSWTVGLKPREVHDVVIDPAASVTVNGPGSNTAIKSLQIGGGTGIATLKLQAGAVITPGNGAVNITPTGVLTGDGTINATITNFGTVAADNLTLTGVLTNNGTINGSGRINAAITNNALGKIQALSDDHLHLTGSSPHTNSGLVDVNGQNALATIEIDSLLTNNASGRVQVRGGAALQFDGGLTNNGIVSLGFADATVSGAVANNGSIGIAFSNATFSLGDLTNSGLIAITDNSRVLFADDVIANGGSDIFVAGGSTAVFFGSYNGGTSGTGDVTSLGDLAPGSSPGAVGFGGSLSFGPSASLQSELAGTDNTPNAPEYDQVNVTANVAINGSLDITLLNSFAPKYFDEFEILTAGTRSGEFDQINGALVNPDMVLAPVYDHNGNTGLTLVAALPGDANLDGTVNGDDLLRWQANLFSGDEFAQGDFNLDGAINGDDLLIWQSHLFDTVPAAAPATAPIPEPGTAVLLIGLGLLGTAMRRRAV